MDSDSTSIMRLMCRCTIQYWLSPDPCFHHHTEKWKKAVWQHNIKFLIMLHLGVYDVELCNDVVMMYDVYIVCSNDVELCNDVVMMYDVLYVVITLWLQLMTVLMQL